MRRRLADLMGILIPTSMGLAIKADDLPWGGVNAGPDLNVLTVEEAFNKSDYHPKNSARVAYLKKAWSFTKY